MGKRTAQRNNAAIFSTGKSLERKTGSVFSHSPAGKTFPEADSFDKQIFVGRAYEEPMGHDQIETILLQRDYIID